MKMGKKWRHFLQISLLGDWPIIRYEKVFTNEPELLDGGGVSLDESLGPDPHRPHPKGDRYCGSGSVRIPNNFLDPIQFQIRLRF